MNEPTRETVTGVLHGTVTPKRRRSFLDQIIVNAFVADGKISYEDRRFFYAPSYYLTTPSGEGRFLWSFKGQPKALNLGLRGHTVTIRATIQRWPNSRGAHLIRPQVLEVSEGLATGHECDSPRCPANTEVAE